MKDKVLSAIETYALLRQGDRVTVGLSGGADSVALLCVLHELCEKLGVTVSAFHVNHTLRGAESDGDEAFCRALCAKLDVPFDSCRLDVRTYCRENGCSIEEGARILRYKALRQAARGGIIATAHHLEDNAETVLLNLARGTALDGLCGIPVKRDHVIRPLLFCSRAEIERYLADRGQDYRSDSTNMCDDAARNRLRHAVLPVMQSINPAFCETVARTTQALTKDRAYLTGESDRLWDALVCSDAICCAPYRSSPEPLRLRVLRRFLHEHDLSVDNRRLLACDALIVSGEGSRPLASDAIFAVGGETARIVRKNPLPAIVPVTLPEETFGCGGTFSCGSRKIEIRIFSGPEIKFFVNCMLKEYKNAVDCDKIKKPIQIRQRAAGDAIRLVGRGCTKTLKKLFSEAKIEPARRDSVAILSDGDGPVWIEGFGVRESAAVSQETKLAFLVTTIGEEIQRGK